VKLATVFIDKKGFIDQKAPVLVKLGVALANTPLGE
jgi:hypothetical protein